MPVLETVTFLAVMLMFVVITAAAYVGVLALVGAVRLVRCERCDHLAVVSGRAVATSCLWCRHELVRHPLHWRHEHGSQASRRS